MKKDCILELENVTKYYGNELVFNNVNLKIKKGEVISLVGKSGSRKEYVIKVYKSFRRYQWLVK